MSGYSSEEEYYSSGEEYYEALEREAKYNAAMEEAQFGLPPSEWAEADAEWRRLEQMEAVMEKIKSLRPDIEEQWRWTEADAEREREMVEQAASEHWWAGLVSSDPMDPEDRGYDAAKHMAEQKKAAVEHGGLPVVVEQAKTEVEQAKTEVEQARRELAEACEARDVVTARAGAAGPIIGVSVINTDRDLWIADREVARTEAEFKRALDSLRDAKGKLHDARCELAQTEADDHRNRDFTVRAK